VANVSSKVQSLGSFAWSIAEILRGDFKQSEYGEVILPFVVLRRLDCILEKSKDAVLKAAKTLPKSVDDATRDMILFGAAGRRQCAPHVNRGTTFRPHDLAPFTRFERAPPPRSP